MTPDDLPEFTLTAMQEFMGSTHELFVSAMASGFSEDQALTLIAKMMKELVVDDE